MSDIKQEIERLNGELFAYRAMLFYFLQRFYPHGPAIVRNAINDAANHAEHAALKFGKTASPLHLAKALEIIEDFRSKIVTTEPGKSGPWPPEQP